MNKEQILPGEQSVASFFQELPQRNRRRDVRQE
jgi:hypothetical protein